MYHQPFYSITLQAFSHTLQEFNTHTVTLKAQGWQFLGKQVGHHKEKGNEEEEEKEAMKGYYHHYPCVKQVKKDINNNLNIAKKLSNGNFNVMNYKNL